MAYYNSPYQGMPYNNPYMDRLNAMTMGAQPPGMGQQQAASGQIIRVNGVPGAQAYQMGANAAVALFDANEDYFYIKRPTARDLPVSGDLSFHPATIRPRRRPVNMSPEASLRN